jgi:hypothetical protein
MDSLKDICPGRLVLGQVTTQVVDQVWLQLRKQVKWQISRLVWGKIWNRGLWQIRGLVRSQVRNG